MTELEPALGWERRSPATSEDYRALTEAILAKAVELRHRWSEAGDRSGVELVDRLIGFLEEQRDNARQGLLPARAHGFALTRFMGDYDWGPDGKEMQAMVYDLQELWASGE
jgi:hypothetical protein